MSRYIDADELKSRMLNYYDCVNESTDKSNYRGETLMNYEVADMIEDCIENAPTADVVEVVRCKDCRFCQNLPNGLCYAWTEPYDNERGYKGEVHCVEPDDFCSTGQRKEQT